VLASVPDLNLPLRVTLVTPVSEIREGRNAFRVEAAFKDPPAGLRPGMTGVAKAEVGRGSVARIWGGRLLDRLRLLTWRWVP